MVPNKWMKVIYKAFTVCNNRIFRICITNMSLLREVVRSITSTWNSTQYMRCVPKQKLLNILKALFDIINYFKETREMLDKF